MEGYTIHLLQELLPKNSQLVVANSMSIRDMDYFGLVIATVLLSTVTVALTASMVPFLRPWHSYYWMFPTVLLTGDLTFFHDLNGLAVAKTHPLNLTIIVHNNDGGGIFEYLPKGNTAF